MRSICVFCGSRDGDDAAFATEAETLGRGLAAAGHRLVYGAGDVGLMGRVARAAMAAGGDTFGVIPQHLLAQEVGKRDLSRLVITETMHERKKVMFANCDAIVLLPGGAGSLDEVFEVLTWAQLGLHTKPILIVNTAGYWTKLIELIDHVIARGFAATTLRQLIQDVPDAAACLAALSSDRSA
ncbi:MAG: TIGR00730 family Rossman fold protein [Pseudomonadota bacterium]